MALGTEQWKPASDLHVSIAGVFMQCKDSEFAEDTEEFDTTNDQSGGAYEFGTAVVTYSLRFTIPVDSADVRIPARGTLLTCIWTDGISTFTGNFRVMQRSRKGGGHGGYDVSVSGKFTGTVAQT